MAVQETYALASEENNKIPITYYLLGFKVGMIWILNGLDEQRKQKAYKH